MLKEFGKDLFLPIPEAEELPRLIALGEATEGLDKLRDDLPLWFRRVGRRG
jgi:hypothetical protein